MMKVRHIKTGEIYEMTRVVKLKYVFATDPLLRDWHDGVEYEKDGHVYVRELYDFFMNFEPLDRGSRDITNMINEVLGEPENQKEEYLSSEQ